MPVFNDIAFALKKHAHPAKAAGAARFFKTGAGEYGEGDFFLGVTVPEQRLVVKKFISEIALPDIQKLLYSKWHEFRLTGVLFLVGLYEKSPDAAGQNKIAGYYLQHLDQVNNWDLVDSSAHKILGPFLEKGPRDVIYELAGSGQLWRQRVAVITTLHFIRQNDFKDIFKLYEVLMYHKHDLMHKAIGWMLREIGKKDLAAELAFLKKHYKQMPRTMLRYAIEKFDEPLRKAILAGKWS